MSKGKISQQIKRWDNSESIAQNIAADLAISILAAKFAELPGNDSVAREWTVSERTVRRAKQLLAGEGLIAKDGTGRYYLPR
jgi:DNA-binding GntR family transcriptional regulator